MEMKKHSPNRQLSEPFTCRYWQDNYDLLMSISEETGRKPNEVARDLMDDALRRHLSTSEPGDNGEILQKLDLLIEQNRLTTQVYEQLIEKYEQLDERSTRLKQGLIQNLREFYAILLESLSASIGARRLAWNYVAHTVLKQTGFNDEQVKQRYEAEKKAWIDEKDNIARALEEAIKKMPPQQ